MESDWRCYEEEIHRHLLVLAGSDADVMFDAQVKGQHSGIERQVDILIVGRFPGLAPGLTEPGRRIKMAVDCKCFSSKVQLADADRFAGFLDDIGVDLGLIVTQTSCTASAKRRILGIRGAHVDVVPVGTDSADAPLALGAIEFAFASYCVRCRTAVHAASATIVQMANGRRRAVGKCPDCGTKVGTFLRN